MQSIYGTLEIGGDFKIWGYTAAGCDLNQLRSTSNITICGTFEVHGTDFCCGVEIAEQQQGAFTIISGTFSIKSEGNSMIYIAGVNIGFASGDIEISGIF
jgi:hypothetical protein